MRIVKKIIFLFLLLMAANIMSISFLTIFTGGLFLISKAAEAGRADFCFLLSLLMLIAFAYMGLFVQSCQKTERSRVR